MATWQALIALLLVLFGGCRGDESSATEQLPLGEIDRIAITPSAVLLTEDLDHKQLQVRAFDAEGREVRPEGLELEWVNADPGDIELVSEGEASASVTALAEVGSGVIVARSTTQPELLTNPVVVRAAVLHPEALALDDADIVFPPPNYVPGTDVLELPGWSESEAGKLMAGSFELSELLLSLTTSSAEDPQFDENGAMIAEPGTRLRYPVVIRREAWAPAATRVLGAESSAVAGKVLEVVERGEWIGLMVEAASVTELYEHLDVEFDGPALDEQGLLNLEALDPQPPAAALEDEGFRADGIPPGLEDFNDEKCAMGDYSGARVTGFSPSITPNILPPKGGVKVNFFELEKFKFYSGVTVAVSIRPELDIQFEGEYTISCYMGKELTSVLGLSSLTASVLDARYKHKPRLDMSLKIGGGPRLNAYVLFLCNAKATMGLDYEDGEVKYGDAQVGDYNVFEAGCNQPEFDATFTGLELWGVGQTDAGIDGYIDAQAGIKSENRLSLLIGGVIMERLMKVIEHGQHVEQMIGEMADRFNAGFDLPFSAPPLPEHWKEQLEQVEQVGNVAEGLLNGILALADIDFISAEFGPNARLRLESTRRLLNEADGGTWYANEHQIYGVQFDSGVEVGLIDFKKLLSNIFPKAQKLHDLPLSISISPPSIDAISFYKGIQGEGMITHQATKGPGNTGVDFEVGDTLLLRVPGDFGQQLGLDLSKSPEPIGGAIFIRNSIWDGELQATRKIGELQYTGTQNDLLTFEGEVLVEDEQIRDHLIARKELYFVSYNELETVDVPGYLGSYADYDLLQVDVDVDPQLITDTVEVAKSSNHLVKLTNLSINADQPVGVEFTWLDAPGWITPSVDSITLAPDGSFDLMVETYCNSAGYWEDTATLRFEVTDPFDTVLGEQTKTLTVQLQCNEPMTMTGEPSEPPEFVGTACPASGGEVDYAALDAELATYQNKDQLQFGLKMLPAGNNQCLPSYYVELPVPCDGHTDYQLWKMGGSVTFNDFGLIGTPYWVWNPHYAADGMWDQYGLIDMEPITLLSYAQEDDPLVPCNDARMDPNHGPVGPIIAQSDHPSMIRAFPEHQRDQPDLSWPANYQQCYDRVELKAGNGLVPCSADTTNGALYLVFQSELLP